MIIADTSGVVASIDVDAAQHKQCTHLLQNSDAPFLISHMVIAETDYLLTKRFGVATSNRFLADVVAGAFELAATDERDLEEALTVNARYADQALGVTDCLNVVLASRYGTTEIFTLDERHFRLVKPLAHGPAFHLLPVDGPRVGS